MNDEEKEERAIIRSVILCRLMLEEKAEKSIKCRLSIIFANDLLDKKKLIRKCHGRASIKMGKLLKVF